MDKNTSFENYYQLLIQHNAMYNLTAITARKDVYTKHFEDSLLGAPLVPDNASIIDVGCGAGFPSLPIVIERADVRATLIDGTRKKVDFVNTVIDALDLRARAQALHLRAEYATQLFGQYDVALSRAVAKLSALIPLMLPLLKVGGLALSYKSCPIDQEIADCQGILHKYKAELLPPQYFQLDSATARQIIVIRKL
jgi:16S rRNA (guanine527-N7)-methyltransferase